MVGEEVGEVCTGLYGQGYSGIVWWACVSGMSISNHAGASDTCQKCLERKLEMIGCAMQAGGIRKTYHVSGSVRKTHGISTEAGKSCC